MKKNTILVAAAALAMMATSCKKEEIEPVGQEPLKRMPITLKATYGRENAKVSYTESGNSIRASWDANDTILVVYDGCIDTLTITEGGGTVSATFNGTIWYTHELTAQSLLGCYVKDAKNRAALTVTSGGTIVYSDAGFLTQDGSMDTAASRNTYYGMTTYGDGTNIKCNFTVNTSMLKFTIGSAPEGVTAGSTATLTYTSGGAELAKATFTVGTYCRNTIYLAVPAGNYTGAQTLVYSDGTHTDTYTLSADHANFVAGQAYSKDGLFFGPFDIGTLTSDYDAVDGITLTGTMQGNYSISVADGATVTLRGVTINGNGEETRVAPSFTCLGDATIVLAEGTTNTVNCYNQYYPGLHVATTQANPKTLTIRGNGTLNAKGGKYGAGIGSGYVYGSNGPQYGYNYTCGNIVIESGTVNATGGLGAAGIGSGYSYQNYSWCLGITINGGTITAQGGGGVTSTGGGGAGIGTGAAYDDQNSTARGFHCGNIYINGGTVTATGGSDGAGIGTGHSQSYQAICKTIHITAGTVTASGGWGGAGIGTGDSEVYYYSTDVSCEGVEISGGEVTANGGIEGAGIGCGCAYAANARQICGPISISGGQVTATGGNYAAGIGSGVTVGTSSLSVCGSISITGGSVTATGQKGSPGIGSSTIYYNNQCTTRCGDISITGGTVKATGSSTDDNGRYGCGIGAGYPDNTCVSQCGNITIANTVTRVTATKANTNSNYMCIGQSCYNHSNCVCGTVTIGGTGYTGVSANQSDNVTYIYQPSKR